MRWFKEGIRKHSQSQGFQKKERVTKKRRHTFILESILTPSVIGEGTDRTPDLGLLSGSLLTTSRSTLSSSFPTPSGLGTEALNLLNLSNFQTTPDFTVQASADLTVSSALTLNDLVLCPIDFATSPASSVGSGFPSLPPLTGGTLPPFPNPIELPVIPPPSATPPQPKQPDTSTVKKLNQILTQVATQLESQLQDLSTFLNRESGQAALETIVTLIDQNPELLNVLTQPETLTNLGMGQAGLNLLHQVLTSPEIAADLGLSTSLKDVLKGANSEDWHRQLINSAAVSDLLTPDAIQPAIGFLDFTAGDHTNQVTQVFQSINDQANYQVLPVSQGNWAERLIQLVHDFKAQGQTHGIVNLSFDLAQVDAEGKITTRYELTPLEQVAIRYAQANNVLLVVAAGNTGDRLSALGSAAQKFDNIITVGAIDRWNQPTDYTSRGDGLTLVAPGGQFETDPDAFVGTSRAAAYVTGAASLAWAANPDLSYQQIREILMATAGDLGKPGWDRETGAGVLDVTEAVLTARFTQPTTTIPLNPVNLTAFSGVNRVNPLERAASAATQQAIDQLFDTQQSLVDQWQLLTLLGNSALTLEDLQALVAQNQTQGLDTYQQVSTQATISRSQAQLSAEALGLATQHYQIEQERLQSLQTRQQTLLATLAELQQQKTELERNNPQQLAAIEQAILQMQQELATVQEKLKYQLVDPKTLMGNPDSIRQEAQQKQGLAQTYQQNAVIATATQKDYQTQAQGYRVAQQRYQSLAAQYQPQPSRPWKRSRPDPRREALRRQYEQQAQAAAQRASLLEAQAQMAGNDQRILGQLSNQLSQQIPFLEQHANFVESQQATLATLTGKPEDGNTLLATLRDRVTQQQQITAQYWREAELAEQWRKQNQDLANRHQSLYQRWEVVGQQTSRGRSGRRSSTPIYGWRYYPEYKPLRDQAQQQANQAEAQRKVLEQWARQSQQQLDALTQHLKMLEQRVQDWPELKRGITYEIAANLLQLQANQDLLNLQTPLQRQQLENLTLQITQNQAELDQLTIQQLPGQQQTVANLQQQLTTAQTATMATQATWREAQRQLQTFLETSGYLLPYRERQRVIQNNRQAIETELLNTQQTLLKLTQQISQTPDPSLQQQQQQIRSYLKQLEQDLAWVKLQQDQLNLAAPDSPQRLTIANLFKQLEERQQTNPVTNTLPLPQWTNFLRSRETSHSDLLLGFDSLSDRLNQAKTEQTALQTIAQRLETEYRNLGLAKTDLENRIAVQQQRGAAGSPLLAQLQQQLQQQNAKLADKYREIELTEQYQKQVQDEVIRLQGRQDLLKQAERLEQQYQAQTTQWNQAVQNQVNAINSLLATRQGNQTERDHLLAQQTALNQIQTELTAAQTRQATLEKETVDRQRALDLANLQLNNRQLQLQRLIAQDAPLASAETYYYNLAQQYRAQIWSWNGQNYVYNASQAQAYRVALQNASLLADERNKVSQQRQTTQQQITTLQQQLPTVTTDLTTKQAELVGVQKEVSTLLSQAVQRQQSIASLNQTLQPSRQQEQTQTQTFQTAATEAQRIGADLAQKTEEQRIALERLLSFGVLASESDLDFFPTQVEPQVRSFIDQIRTRNGALQQQADRLGQLLTGWQQDMNAASDPVSRQALQSLIAKTQTQQVILANQQQQNGAIVTQLETRLQQILTTLPHLRQQQELKIRQELQSNGVRLAALESQLQTEKVADAALKANTVLGYAQLNDRVQQDIQNAVQGWTNTLLQGHQQTKELGDQQRSLSQSVDHLLVYIEDNLANPFSQYQRSRSNLQDDLNTLGVIAPRQDELQETVTLVQQDIEQIKLWIAQDAQLWQEIAPIATRYGAESQELQVYQQRYQSYRSQDQALANQYEQERQRQQAAANSWNSQVNSWGITGWTGGKRSRPIYGWIYNPQAAANRNAAQAAANAAQQRRDAALKFPQANAYRQSALDQGLMNNGTAIDLLQEEAQSQQARYQQQINALKATQDQADAQKAATLAQADWYEKQAAYHWEHSRKQGPTWKEYRETWRRRWTGRKKKVTVELIHVDHHWILWDTYVKYAAQLRGQSVTALKDSREATAAKDRLTPLAEQWVNTGNAANEAEAAIDASRNVVDALRAARESMPAIKEQLKILEDLLPDLQQELTEARQETANYTNQVQVGWDVYNASRPTYQQTLQTVLERQGEINRQSQILQQELIDAERWVEQQSVGLRTEIEQAQALRSQLQTQQQAFQTQLASATGNHRADLETKQAQLTQALSRLENKATVLAAQQTALTQKRTMLTAQNEVILAEQRLVEAFLSSPAQGTDALQQQLQDARTALAEAQRLAEQAEASSQLLTGSMQDLQTTLIAQRDEQIRNSKAQQAVLKQLLSATELSANYALQAAQKQREVNDLELQILTRLQQAAAAGFQEAKYLLDVATRNDIATAAELYYRDYHDIASDRGGKCAGGVARPEDRILADRYYREMLTQRELQRRAQEQANQFRKVKEKAQAQSQTLQTQQADAAKELDRVNALLAQTQAEREQKQQELAVAQARLDGISRLHQQTEQLYVQMLSLEKLNLAQAQLEQQIATRRQSEIEQAVFDRIQRENLELERQRLETQARIEQLRQFQTEEELRTTLNQVRGDLGMATLNGNPDVNQWQTQLAALLAGLQTLNNQKFAFSDNMKALLAEVQGDIQAALQGKEANTIQENLLKTAAGLIGQAEQYQTELIANFDLLFHVLEYTRNSP
ncbi:MAG: S8 family serine peptidase, partial [Leptolyngbyaceae cyanobacterium bins.59]|nr:S8 family serine peptidase [Leptolyngbyaceae cyanobacterium bins.59]